MYRIRPIVARLVVAVLVVASAGCEPDGASTNRWSAAPRGRIVELGGGVTAALPPLFHEVPTNRGRAFRVRGAETPSFATLSVQFRLDGEPAQLDTALLQVVDGLRRQASFDLLDIQLFYIGGSLALGYTAKFDQLDVIHRQWGVLISTPDGLVALLMTAPSSEFAAASNDFMEVLFSLDCVRPS